METIPPSRQLKAPLYAVTRELENNYHDDSDFYVIAFDPTTRSLARHETWTTRFACVARPGRWFVPVEETPEEVLAMAEERLAEQLEVIVGANDKKDVEEPQVSALANGMRLRLHRDVRTRGELGTLKAGIAGTVFWWGSHGRFFRNGYNQPNRSNTRVGMTLDDGRKAFVVLEACRLDREVMTPEEVKTRARTIAKDRNFNAVHSRHVLAIR